VNDDEFQWTPHPILAIPEPHEFEILTPEQKLERYKSREILIEREMEDPYNYGFFLNSWKIANNCFDEVDEVLIMGGNRSGKSRFAAWLIVNALVQNPNTIIWCYQTTHENSVSMQQKEVYNYLPTEYKTLGKGKVGYVKYSVKRGFTDSKFVLPNGSECTFRNLSQDIATVEGAKLGGPEVNFHNIGVWLDEAYVNGAEEWIDTLRYRLISYGAKMLVTFTPKDGYTSVVKSYLNGARTIKSRKAALLNNQVLPIVQQPMRKNSRIVYFWTKDNPYPIGNYKNLERQLDGAPREEILMRAYGVATKPIGGKFPKFHPDVNIVKHEEIPFIKDKDSSVTYYHCIDPSGSKPWFMLWAGVTPQAVYIWAEWPDIGHGLWADMSKGSKGRPGDACRPNGFGIKDYIDLVLDIENDREPLERIIDPRMGVATIQNKEGVTSILDDLQENGMEVIPANISDNMASIENGLQKINSWLAYDNDRPVDSMNHPKLYISDRCEQLIYAMEEYTGTLGKDEPTKDPIDCLRYFAISDIQHISKEDYWGTVRNRY